MATMVHRVVVVRLLAMAACMVGLALPASAQTKSVKDMARRALPAVVTIVTFDGGGHPVGQGSGFIVGANGVVVTNFHVIDGVGAAVVILRSGDRHQVQGVLEVDVEKDFAILQIKGADLPTLPLGNSERLEPGDPVIAMGSPVGEPGTVTTGTVSQLRQAEGFRMVQHSAAISPGSSGGPLVLENGEVVGVNTSSRTDANSMFFAVPVNYVRAALESTASRLVSLGDLTERVRKARRAKAETAFNELFATYRDPENLFTMSIPRAWQVQRSAWTDQEGTYHVLVMSHAPTAQVADINGWLSEGLRLHLTFPKKGYVWRQDFSAEWIHKGAEDMVRGYARYESVGTDAVRLGGIPAQRIAVIGVASHLREAEASVMYYMSQAKGRVVVDLSAPASKVDILQAVRAVFEATFKVGWQQ